MTEPFPTPADAVAWLDEQAQASGLTYRDGPQIGDDDDDQHAADGALVPVAEVLAAQAFATAMAKAREAIVERRERVHSTVPLGGYNAADLVEQQMPDVEWIIRSIIQREAVGVVGAEYKGCKSWLACEVAVSLSSGDPFLGKHHVERPGWVLYIAFEDSARNMRSRLRAIALGRRIDVRKALGRIQVIPRPASLNIASIEGQAWIVAHALAMKEPPVLIIIDPLGNAHTAKSENDSAEMQPAMNGLRVVRDVLDVSLLVPHHFGKPPGERSAAKPGRIEHRLRGSTSIFASVDAWMLIDQKHDEQSDEHRRWDVTIIAGTREGGGGKIPASLDVRLKDNKTADVAAWALREEDPTEAKPAAAAKTSAKGSELVLNALKAEFWEARRQRRPVRPLSAPLLAKQLNKADSTVGDWLGALKARGIAEGDHRGAWLKQQFNDAEGDDSEE